MIGRYRAYRRWTDRDLVRPGKPVSLYLPLTALIISAVIVRPSLEEDVAFIVGAGLIFLFWQGWVIWRAIHMMRVADFVVSKKYEAEGRYRLSKEYHDSEFASARGRRLRRQRK